MPEESPYTGPANVEMRNSVIAFLARQKLAYQEDTEQYCAKFTVKKGAISSSISVFNTARLVIGGKDSALKQMLMSLKKSLEEGHSTPGTTLPFEIERFPETVIERVPLCDPVIIRFLRESIDCLKAGALLASAFMLGAASERAVSLLIISYADAIKDEVNKKRFSERVAQRQIAARFDEFAKSFKSCKSRPSTGVLAHDVDVVIGAMFQFCRITRNEVGHPQIVPDLDRGVVIANMGQFVTYVERVYALIDHFAANPVVV